MLLALGVEVVVVSDESACQKGKMDVASRADVGAFESVTVITYLHSHVVYDSFGLIMPVLDHQSVDPDLSSFLGTKGHDNEGLSLYEAAVDAHLLVLNRGLFVPANVYLNRSLFLRVVGRVVRMALRKRKRIYVLNELENATEMRTLRRQTKLSALGVLANLQKAVEISDVVHEDVDIDGALRGAAEVEEV